ncbi:glycosyltransferase [Methylocystis sp. IM3]|uniref:glycosyltransferase n=1 Tax=unclassified Methylocystis TaxID=2625913 RepID=UPI0030F564E5
MGKPKGFARVVLNGISTAELTPVETRTGAADLLYVGELRDAKGVDTLIDAVALLARRGVTPSVLIVGDGPDRALLEARARGAGVGAQIAFGKPCRARDAFALGKAMVVPSRFESLPYVVLEAAGARVPLVATNVGGMAEIFGPQADRLIAAHDPARLADALQGLLAETPDARARQAQALADHVASRFSLPRMADEILDSYYDALLSRRRP